MWYQQSEGVKTIVNVEWRRKELNLTQAQLAEKAGVTQGAISMIERGERVPSLDVLVKIADALGCKIDELIRKEESA
jgi:transcriptional regulator with XRE-family HTH domain